MLHCASLILLALASTAACAGGGKKGDFELLRVVVVHRHGARKPDGLVNDSICDHTKTGCGYLMHEGFSQLRSLGNHLRSWYDSLLPDSYDPDVVETQTTDVARTCQSANAFLQGLFKDDKDPISPVMTNRPADEDYVLVPKMWPSFKAHWNVTKPHVNEELLQFAKMIADPLTLAQIAQETSQFEVCPSDPVECLHLAQDIEASMKAEDKLNGRSYAQTAGAPTQLICRV